MRLSAAILALLLTAAAAPALADTPAVPVPQAYGSVPIPDPTTLTTQLVDRAISNLKLELAAEFRAAGQLKELVRSWIDTGDRVRDERFARIDKQFEQSDKLQEKLALANSTAISAALQAAKDAAAASNAERVAATAKSDAAFADQLKTQQTLITAEAKNLNDKVNDLKDRFAQREGGSLAARDTKADSRGDNSLLVAYGALAVALAGVLIGLFRRPAPAT